MKIGRSYRSKVIAVTLTKVSFAVVLLAIALSGCLSKESSTSSSSSNGGGGALGFSGATTAINLDGTRIKISWVAATSSHVGGYDIYEVSGGGDNLTWLSRVPSNYLYHIHSGLTPGTLHSYVVRAVDSTSTVTDDNLKTVAAFTYAGITSVTPIGTTTATVNFPAGGQAAEVRIYGTTLSATTLIATVDSTTTSANLTGLVTGRTYTFKAMAVSSGGYEDNNTVTVTAQTTSLTSSKYNGPIAVSAYGDAPNAPAGTPQTKQVSITWAAFTGATASTQYKLLRVAKDNAFDTSVTSACTNSTTSTCQVCTATGTGAKTCTDTNIAASPQKYDYTIILTLSSGWTEEMPAAGDSSYRITVPTPPENMVLVQRDAANFEQCSLMGRTPDPLNHQRCTYNGLGATPYNTNPGNTPLGLSTSYYDFGYNLFVDRWAAACNWTAQASGGMCGAGITAGDCFGNVDPPGTKGILGNVYYRTDNGNCFYRQSGSWVAVNSTSLSTAERTTLHTIDPGAAEGKPPLVQISQLRAYDTCQSAVDTNYGPKRLIRRREFSVAAAAPWLTGEPGALTDGQITTLEQGAGHGAGVYSCNSDNHAGIASGPYNTSELAGDAADAVKSVIIGSLATSKCVSRYGLQDFAGNVWQWASDQMSCSNVSHTCTGATSSLDTGNIDMNGFLFNGVQGPGSTTGGQTGPNYTQEWTIQNGIVGGTGSGQGYGAGYFSTPLGLPMVGTDSGNAMLITSFSTKLHSDYFYLYSDNGTASRGLIVGGAWNFGTLAGRWLSYWGYAPSHADNSVGLRCALPAE